MRAGKQGKMVELLAHLRVVERHDACELPFLPQILGSGGVVHDRYAFNGMHDRGIGKLRQPGEMVVERVTVHTGLSNDVGHRDLPIRSFPQERPERILQTLLRR